MDLLASFQDAARDYWKDIPKNTGKQMIYSFAFSGAIRFLVSGNVYAGLSSGSAAALATAVHGLVTPVFVKVFAYKARLTWEEEMCRTTIALIGSGYLASAFGDTTVLTNHFGLTILYGLWNHIEPNRRDLDSAAWFGIMPNVRV